MCKMITIILLLALIAQNFVNGSRSLLSGDPPSVVLEKGDEVTTIGPSARRSFWEVQNGTKGMVIRTTIDPDEVDVQFEEPSIIPGEFSVIRVTYERNNLEYNGKWERTVGEMIDLLNSNPPKQSQD